MTSLGGTPLASQLQLQEKWAHGSFLFSAVLLGQCLLPAEPTLCANLPLPRSGAKQKAPLSEPRKIGANRRRAAWSQLTVSQAPVSCSESQEPRRRDGWCSLRFPGEAGRGVNITVGVRWSPLGRGGWGVTEVLDVGCRWLGAKCWPCHT